MSHIFSKTKLAAIAAVALMPTIGLAASLDLTGFSKYGDGNGTWNVASDGLSVTQTRNTSTPTAFVGGTDFVNSTFEGQIRPNSNGDDDYIGFVFGFGADDTTPFYLFDWKRGQQSGSNDGFTLSRVTGDLNSIPFGNHQTSATGYTVIDTMVDTTSANTLGWSAPTVYDFKLTYQTNRILIEMGGGAPVAGTGLTTIFDIDPSDVAGVSSFTAGRFGFYNYSQSDVTYQGFTAEDTPAVPLPAGAVLLISGIGAMALRRRKG